MDLFVSCCVIGKGKSVTLDMGWRSFAIIIWLVCLSYSYYTVVVVVRCYSFCYSFALYFPSGIGPLGAIGHLFLHMIGWTLCDMAWEHDAKEDMKRFTDAQYRFLDSVTTYGKFNNFFICSIPGPVETKNASTFLDIESIIQQWHHLKFLNNFAEDRSVWFYVMHCNKGCNRKKNAAHKFFFS